MRTILVLLTLLLAACSSQPAYDPRIPLDWNQVLRDVSRRDVENYKCRDGTPLVAESRDGWRFDLRCDGRVIL